MSNAVRIHRTFIFLFLLLPSFTTAQRNLNPRSGIVDSSFLAHKVKSISDTDLFAAMDLTTPALGEIRSSVDRKDFASAFQAWGRYWKAKLQPRYVTQNFRMLIDTDMLTDYDSLRAYVRQYPAERDTIVKRADMLVNHKIPAWGDLVLEFGKEVDFNRNVGQTGKYGFHYWIWSRPLNAAYALTGDQKYTAAFDDLFQQWYDQRNRIDSNIPDLDVVYYELGLGVRNRMFIEYYFLPYSKRTWKTHEKMLKSVLGAARWLYELELWEGYRSGNWQIHGSYMLTQIALTFPEFRESGQWLQLGLQRLKEHLEQDFFDDGGHSERAPRNYTQATYVSYRNLYYLLTAHRIHVELAQEIRQRMANTIDWWITMIAPTGEVPAINDSHRGMFPAYLLQDAATFYRKPEAYGVLRNLLGVASPIDNPPLPSFTSRHMPSSGFTVMRTDWTRDALYMNLNYGKWNGSHTHSDMLDFEIYAYGKPLAVDAGLGLTYDDPLYVPWYKSSRAHNMVVINNENIEREHTEGKGISWFSSATLDFFAGEHDGYASKGAHHRRSIAFVKPGYWVIHDRITSQKTGDTVSWYLHTPLHLAATTKGYRSSEAPGFSLHAFPSTVKAQLGEGMAASTRDPVPGRTEQIQWIALNQLSDANKPTEFTVTLVPFRTTPENIEVSTLGDGRVLVKRNNFTEELWFPASHPVYGRTTDAEFVMIRTAKDGGRTFSIVNGTFLTENSREIWKSGQRSSVENVR